MLLIFTGRNIIQMNMNTKQIVTIFNTETDDNEFFKIFSIYNYNKKLKKFEQMILLKDGIKDKIYPYYFNDNTLLLKKDYFLPKFIALIEYNIFGKNEFYYKNEESPKIFIEQERLIIIN